MKPDSVLRTALWAMVVHPFLSSGVVFFGVTASFFFDFETNVIMSSPQVWSHPLTTYTLSVAAGLTVVLIAAVIT